ncbi:hypothetical protein [Simkania sp.]|uniref:hypothetical protein n=1 Tax=Simkania sp. TaxID=34094 RepID=UPI003B519965
MSDSGGVTPPSSGSSPPPSSKDAPPAQIQTGMGKAYDVKGDTAIRNWAKHFFPGMSEDQLNRFVQQFMQSICQEISRQIGKEMQQQKKTAQKLKRAEEGDD